MGIRKVMSLVLYLPPDAMTTLMSQHESETPKEKTSPVDQLQTLARALQARPQDGA